MNPEAQLPIVYQTAANLYQSELFSLQLQGGRVRKATSCGLFNLLKLPIKARFAAIYTFCD